MSDKEQGTPPGKLPQSELSVEIQDMKDVPTNPDQPDGTQVSTLEEKIWLQKTTRRKIQPNRAQNVSPELKISGDAQKKSLDDITPSERSRKKIKNEKAAKDLKIHFWGIVIFVAYIAIYFYSRQSTTTEWDPITSYQSELWKMQAKYINQTTHFWTTFLSASEPILMMDEPDLPAVVMLAVPNGHHPMALCFAQHLAEVLNKLLGGKNPVSSQPTYVDGSTMSSLGPDEQKEKIDKEIHKIIQSKQKTIIIDWLEKFHPQAVMLFHGFCDNSEANYKDIAIIFILEVPAESNFTKDEEVYSYLFKLWNELNPGSTKALLARIANNVAIMQKVGHFIC